jgi:hypothetical protein
MRLLEIIKNGAQVPPHHLPLHGKPGEILYTIGDNGNSCKAGFYDENYNITHRIDF